MKHVIPVTGTDMQETTVNVITGTLNSLIKSVEKSIHAVTTKHLLSN